MHIAVCDDNVADRKQLERLLKRESERRMSASGILYVDSFGDADTLLRNPMQYDAFFIDMCKGTVTGMDVVDSLTALGCPAPVILCSSDINYRECPLPGRALCLDKPVKVAELAAVIDRALEIKQGAVPVIELREDKETFYVQEKDILYAVENGRNLIVTLSTGRKVTLTTTALNFFSQVEAHESFFSPSVKIIINGRYIKETGFRKIIMTDGTVFKAAGRIMEYAKYIHEKTPGPLQ